MSLEHIPSAILTATLLLRLARLVRHRYLRALIRTSLLTAASPQARCCWPRPAMSSPSAPS